MEVAALRRKLGLLLSVCCLILAVCYVTVAYLMVKRSSPRTGPSAQIRQAAPQDSQDLLAAAEDNLKHHRVEQALVNFREALSLNPQSLQAQMGVAEGEYLAGRESVAAREYARVLRLDARNQSALLALARIGSHQARTWPESENRYRDYLALNPNDTQAKLELARVLAWQGKAAEASALFEQADVARRMNISDRRDFAFSLIKLGRNSEAEPVLRKLLADRPDDAQLSVQLANIYAARKDWNSALPIYQALLRKRPADPYLNLNYGLALLAAKDYRAALDPLARARAAMPSSGKARLAYARAVKGSGNLKKAVKEYALAAPYYQSDASVTREYADALVEKHDYKKAARYYEKAYGLGLRDDRLLAGYAGALMGEGKYKAALPYMQELYRRRPTQRTTFELARIMYKLGRYDEARQLLRQVEGTSEQASRIR